MVKDWILKAESDLKIGKDEMLTDAPVTDAICFHMQQADKLTMYAVEFRYPGEVLFPSLEETREAIEIAEKVKMFILEKLCRLGFNLIL